MRAATSPATEPVVCSSVRTITRLVLRTVARMASWSRGLMVRRSRTSRSIPSRFEAPGGLQRHLEHSTVGDDGQVAPLARQPRLADRHRPSPSGKLVLDAAVEVLVLEVEHRVGVVDRRPQQPVGVGHGARRHDLQARRVLEVATPGSGCGTPSRGRCRPPGRGPRAAPAGPSGSGWARRS